jgi:hypothetical protein
VRFTISRLRSTRAGVDQDAREFCGRLESGWRYSTRNPKTA